MPRTPVAAVARLERISVRATEGEIGALDRIRGRETRSDFIRNLIRAEIARLTGRTQKTEEIL